MRISTVQLVILVNLSVFVIGGLTGSTIEEDSQNSKNCKNFCDFCGCTGFYCGEECICECNQENGKTGDGTECISTVQTNAKKMRADFEILIQGPRGNRFLQDAQEFNQNQHCLHDEEGREKRSTVVIYKPTVTAYKDEVTKLHSKIKKLEKAIVKRDVQQQQEKSNRQYRPKWFQRDDSLLATKFFLKNNDTTETLYEKKKQPTKQSSSKKIATTLENVDIQTKNTDKRKGKGPVKRSFLGLGGLHLPKIGILDDVLEPIPTCLLDASVEFASEKFESAVVLLREAADDLLENISKDLQRKADCFKTSFSKKDLWSKLINLPGISCLEKLFPRVRLCDLLDPFSSNGRPFAKFHESLFGELNLGSPLD